MESQKGKANRGDINVSRALGVIIPLCLLGTMLGGLVIYIANDMYAFVKPDMDVTVTVSAPISDKDFSLLLQESGVIENPLVFRMYIRSKDKTQELTKLSGEIKLNSNMSYREILLEIF